MFMSNFSDESKVIEGYHICDLEQVSKLSVLLRNNDTTIMGFPKFGYSGSHKLLYHYQAAFGRVIGKCYLNA